MNDPMVHLRYGAFRQDYLAWTAVHHFLPAGLLRELCVVIVAEISTEGLQLSDLFDEEMSNGPIYLQSWIIRPTEVSAPLAEYLQSRIRLLAWKSDGPVGGHEKVNILADGKPAMLDAAIQLGGADIETLPEFDDAKILNSDSASALVAAIRALKPGSGSEGGIDDSIIGKLSSLNSPLNAVAVKHLGDLCGDADRWQDALSLYRHSASLIQTEQREEWQEFTEALDAIIQQSVAAALRIVEGPSAAASELIQQIARAASNHRSFLAVNASHDALVASASAGDTKTWRVDRRAAVCLSPLLLHVHNNSSALGSWTQRRFADANRHFWAALRRQIALGSASTTRVTKLHYSRNLFEELVASLGKHIRPSWFQLAVRLSLESGEAEAIEGLKWERTLVRRYVSAEVIGQAITHAEAHLGDKLERTSVLIEIFRGWIGALSADRADIAGAMLRFIASQATADHVTKSGPDLARRSLEVLSALSRKRPEFRREVSSEIVDVLIPWIEQKGPWMHRAEALEVASEYLQVLPTQDVLRVATSVLRVLRDVEPEADFWPFVRPALALLVSREVKDLSEQLPEVGHQVIGTVLRFGLAQPSERTRVFLYLHDFDERQLANPQVANQLAELIPEVRARAQQVNSSHCVDNIVALLLAPAIAGRDGVTDALGSLLRVLKSTSEPHASIAFQHAYEAILLLSNRWTQIADAAGVDAAVFRLQVQPLIDELDLAWRRASENPAIFAPFALPRRSTPHPVLVQNWAYASEQLASAFGEGDRIRLAMQAAAVNEDLRVPIGLGHELGAASDSRFSSTISVANVASEDEEAFYSALGQRLLALRNMADDEVQVWLYALVSRCLALGPHGADLAIFSSSLEHGLRIEQNRPDLQDYLGRLASEHQLSLAIQPMLRALGK